MSKIIFVFLLCLQFLLAIDFKECRYIYAIDKKLEFEGSIQFSQKSIKIEYEKPQKQSIVYSEEDSIEQKRYFFTILKAIYFNEKTLLKEYFQIKKEGDKTLLLPLDMIKEYIKKVEYKKEKEHLKYLEIIMQNKDWIKIETLE